MRVFNGWLIQGSLIALEFYQDVGLLPQDYLWRCWMKETFDWSRSALPNIPGSSGW